MSSQVLMLIGMVYSGDSHLEQEDHLLAQVGFIQAKSEVGKKERKRKKSVI
jgi:hypothetical protein